MAIFETNSSEAIGFIKHFVNTNVILLTLFIIVIAVSYIKLKIKPINRNSKYFYVWQKIFFFIFLLSAYDGRWYLYGYKPALPIQFYKEYKSFRWELETIKIKKQRKYEKFQNISNIFENKKQTFVIIIGESASREHYSIYGYSRNTNPLLSKRTDIYAFNNVTSPHAQTLMSLKKVLTFANKQDMSPLFTKGSILNYFKDAGFKTFWITNQENLGRHSTFTSVLSSDADVIYSQDAISKEAKKINTNDYDLKSFYEKALNDTANKKVIFLHFAGSHSPYDRLTLDGYTPFNKGKTRRQKEIDHYDNTIVLNDFVLNNYIDLLKNKDEISYLLYFSDHGEDCRDTSDSCFCHHENHSNRKIMLTIPLITWISDKYKKERPIFTKNLKDNLNKKYNTEDLIHSIISLSGLFNQDLDKSKSIFDK